MRNPRKQTKGVESRDNGFIFHNMTIKESEEYTGKHGKGKFCSKCGAKKDTKKVKGKYLCHECRKDSNE
jgi:NADH pyrophosphatase NudC (nudix superfamily)